MDVTSALRVFSRVCSTRRGCRSIGTDLDYACSTICSSAPNQVAARTTGNSRTATDRIIVRLSDGLSDRMAGLKSCATDIGGLSGLPRYTLSVEEMAIRAQPLTRALVIGTRVRDKAPEMARVIETAQMHQLVNQHVVAHRIGHQHKTPVETDV